MRRSVPLSLTLIALVLLVGVPLTGGQETEHAFVGNKKRIRLIVKDLVNHFEKRLDAIEGKAVVAVFWGNRTLARSG